MQKRKIEVNYGNTDENSQSDYTFVIPNEKYKDININYNKKESNAKKETKKSKKNKS